LRFLVVILSLVAVVSSLFSSSPYNPLTGQAWAAVCQSIAVPAYFYPNPTTYWDQSFAAAPTVGLMVVNPASGPGSTIDSNYANVIARGRDSGVGLYGYVASGYATRSLAAVQSEIDKWKTMYGLTDIFIDEVTTDTGHLPYYQSLNDYVKSKTPGAKTIANPGTVPAEGYTSVADIIIVFEGSYSSFNGFTFPSWFQNHPASKFWHLVYNVPNGASMQAALARTAQLNAGHVYITHDNLPNPWNTLPPYWQDEVAAVAATCSSPPPTPTPTNTAAATSTATASPQPSPTATNTTTPTMTATPTQTAAATSTATASPQPSPTATNTTTPTMTATPTQTPTSTAIASPTPTSAGDITPPTVTIWEPSDGDFVSRNSTVRIRVNASDSGGIRRVEFSVNGSEVCTDRSAPYNCYWDVPRARDRAYTLRAEAMDMARNMQATSITVTSR
jgi:hypothetical protein